MLMDKRAMFADKLAVPATAATAIFGDYYDLTAGMGFNYQNGAVVAASGNITDQPGNDEDLYLVGIVTTVFAVGTSLQFKLVSATANDLTTGQVVHVDTGTMLAATLVAGYQFFGVQLPRGVYQRYLGIIATSVGAGATGNVSIFLTTEPRVWFATADAII